MEHVNSKILPLLKQTKDLIEKFNLYSRCYSASINSMKACVNWTKLSNLNHIINPLLKVLKRSDLESGLAEDFAQGLFNLCIAYEKEEKHPNIKILQRLLEHLMTDLCTDVSDQLALKK
jgi:hypothetical protein